MALLTELFVEVPASEFGPNGLRDHLIELEIPSELFDEALI